MYAIETKKRKFDRILETIKDHASPRTQSPVTPLHTTTSATSLAENSLTKKRRLAQASRASKSSSVTSQTTTATYLPTSREAFLDRLETFGPITRWHVASTEDVHAAAWAKRGWRCIDTDTVGCRACNEHLLVKLGEDDEAAVVEPTVLQANDHDGDGEEESDSAATLRHQLLVDKYRDMIVTAHEQPCPWRNRGCDDSIQHIDGLLSTKNAVERLKARYDGLRKFDVPSVQIPSEGFSWSAEDTKRFRFSAEEAEAPDPDTLFLAIAGWQSSTEREDIAECRACFRSLGLWLYRGDAPVMERLEAVDSHLEYCPWRSPDAQNTKIDVKGKKELVPAWALVGRAMREVVQQSASASASGPAADSRPEEREPLGEKEREAKVKELLRRVKDLKKPFNVKSFLRKKPAKPAKQ